MPVEVPTRDTLKKQAWIIIVTIVGSGIFVIPMNLLVNSWSQPDIQINPQAIDNGRSIADIDFKILNSGNAPATNVRITIAPYQNMSDYRVLFSSERIQTGIDNVTKALVADLPRLAKGAEVELTISPNTADPNFKNKVFVTYDQGSKSLTYTYARPVNYDIIGALTGFGTTALNAFISVLPVIVVIGIAIIIYKVITYLRDEYDTY